MKKLLLAALGLFAISGLAHAMAPEELQYVPFSSFTDVSTNGNMLFSSAPIAFVGITVSSPAVGSSITIYRSTSPTWTPDISTQAMIVTDYVNLNGGPQFVDLFGMTNTSYTHINKAGTAKLIFWINCPREKVKNGQPYWGFCPGLPVNAQLNSPMMRLSE